MVIRNISSHCDYLIETTAQLQQSKRWIQCKVDTRNDQESLAYYLSHCSITGKTARTRLSWRKEQTVRTPESGVHVLPVVLVLDINYILLRYCFMGNSNKFFMYIDHHLQCHAYRHCSRRHHHHHPHHRRHSQKS